MSRYLLWQWPYVGQNGRTRKKSVNPAQREDGGGPAVRGIEFTSNGGGGVALPRLIKRRKAAFYEVIKMGLAVKCDL
jgi:hypothetical protein